MCRIVFFSLLLALAFWSISCQPAAPETTAESGPLAVLNKAVREEPRQPGPYLERARWYLDNEDYEAAIADLEQVLRLDSSRAETYHQLASAYLNNARSAEAIEVLRRARQLFPDTLRTGLKLSYYLHITQQYEASLRTLAELKAQAPQSADVYFLAGLNFREMGDTARAIGQFQEAVELDPEVQGGDGFLLLGELYAAKGLPLALRYFDNAIAVAPQNEQTFFAKANYLADRGELAAALEVYRELVLRDPQFAPAYFNSGLLYLDLDSLARARQQFDLAVKTSPVYIEAYYYRAVTSEMMGKREAAIRDYQQVLRLEPELREAQEALARLQGPE